MAARRLLIVMLVLLGLSTLAAALIPQSPSEEGSTQTTTQATTTTAPEPSPLFLRPTKITVGGKKLPVVSPVRVGDQLTLIVRSRIPAQIEIPEFGQLAFAAPDAPARFELLAETPGTVGILFATTGKVAAQIRVVPPGKKQQQRSKRSKAKRRARAGSGRA
jgi:hypothetical protein